jgi:hypothetical protein
MSIHYRDGDRVRDLRTGLRGTVRMFDLTEQDKADGCAAGEVRWHNSFVCDELDVAIHNGLIKERPTII